jgi:hypothetical protein
MKNKFWQVACVILFLYAVTLTWSYWQIKQNPAVIRVNSDGTIDQKLTSFERVTFLKQFVQQLLSYQSNSFWQSQMSLTNFMDAELKESRKSEIIRAYDKLSKKKMEQKVDVLKISESKDGTYVTTAKISLREKNGYETLRSKIRLKLRNVERSVENPLGLLVTDMNISMTSNAQTEDPLVHIHPSLPVYVTFPCQVENLEIPKGEAFEAKLTTLNISEVQLHRTKVSDEEATIKARCHDGFFNLKIAKNEQETDLWIAVPESFKQKAINPYSKTLEKELGFIIKE